MQKSEDYGRWAKETCVEVFRDAGVVLKEDDPVVLVTAVFRRALQLWLVENRAALLRHTALLHTASAAVAEAARKAIAEEFNAQAMRLRTDLLKDAESASVTASSAVNQALSIPERKNLWRARAEGLFAGALLVITGAVLMHWLSR